VLRVKNRWLYRGKGAVSHGILKEIIALTISLCLMAGVYISACSAFKKTATLSSNEYFSDTLLFGLNVSLTSLTVMVFLSSCVCACGALLMSRELETIFSGPITPQQFITGKAADIALSSRWMLTIFGIPMLIACGQTHTASVLFYLLTPIILIALWIPAVLFAMSTVLFLATLLPVQRGRELFLLLLVSVLAAFLFAATPSVSSSEGSTLFTHMLLTDKATTISTALRNSSWFPPSIAADAVLDLLHGRPILALKAITLFAGCGAALWLLLVASYPFVHHRAIAKAHVLSTPYRINSRSAQRLAAVVLPFARPVTRAIATKEAKVFSRDITHTVQLGMLLTICFIYLHSFRSLKHPDGLSADAYVVWEVLLLAGNTVLSSLVIISICSRFVFPSVSLEGTSFWIILSSPLSHGDLLRAKCKGWLLPVLFIGAVVFASGAMALDATGELVIASCIAGAIISYGIVGLAIGLGAVFAQFDAEHSSQVSTSLGGFIFIFAAMTLVALDTLPLLCMFCLRLLFPPPHDTLATDLVALYAPLTALVVINVTATALSIRAGRRALRLLPEE
jgi:ABC-2 type transport system permease protein